MRIRQRGLTVQLARDALCYHAENTTAGRQSVSNVNSSRELFLALWKSQLANCEFNGTRE
jgi:hypothetical protein